MQKFELVSEYKPQGDQPQAIAELTEGLLRGDRLQTLLGVTGSGKTYTMAHIVANLQRPTLVISHNKTLAAQLYSEFREFFPNNAVHYFVSYYDYYQPEAYIPSTDTYIEKDIQINEEIDRLRLASTASLLTRRDVIIVASVSCIYGIGSPKEYEVHRVEVKQGEFIKRNRLLRALVDIRYERNDVDFSRGNFRARGDVIEVYPAYADTAYRIELFGDEIDRITEIDTLTGEVLAEHQTIEIFPAKHFMTDAECFEQALLDIEAELQERIDYFVANSKLLEAQRIEQRSRFDLEMLREIGYCQGVENYSRHLSGLAPGEPPYCLINYFPDDYLMIVDESHVTLPQIRGMYRGDQSRKQSLVDYGFRLPSALDNRPLRFEEFEKYINQAIFASATPGPYELEHSAQVAEQIIRPTGLIDPLITVHPVEGQIDHLIGAINERVARKQRVLITTLTKRMAEDLTDYLAEAGLKVDYLHSDIHTLDRTRILKELREGSFDALVGINLLREGLDLPEVSLVAILDADRAGFLRSETSLIQTAGRAARNVDGEVILYADEMTDAIRNTINETERRRKIQMAYNEAHGITPATIDKAIRDLISETAGDRAQSEEIPAVEISEGTSEEEIEVLIAQLTKEMREAATNLEFEKAAALRDQISEIKLAIE
ncbi:MAG: excinuclease ABC subunit UvrB [Candidatus Poribacteria bacterium]|nr:excinuclease ABC subunit UvrB [Candidatus Poribacteria bacterium]